MSDNPALAIAARVLSGEQTARSIVDTALADIAERNAAINAFTHVTAKRALEAAATLEFSARIQSSCRRTDTL